MINITHILFDFGGCLDGNGVHPRAQFLTVFHRWGLVARETAPAFQQAYGFADQRIMREGLAVSLDLGAMNRLMTRLIMKELGFGDDLLTEKIADEVSRTQIQNLVQNRGVLESLSKTHLLGICSNFSGNLEIILKQFELHGLFSVIIESFHAKVSKPDARIFELALEQLKTKPAQCLFVGDSPEKDIVPARKLGMRTVLLHEPGKKTECGANRYIEDLRELIKLTKAIS